VFYLFTELNKLVKNLDARFGKLKKIAKKKVPSVASGFPPPTAAPKWAITFSRPPVTDSDSDSGSSSDFSQA